MGLLKAVQYPLKLHCTYPFDNTLHKIYPIAYIDCKIIQASYGDIESACFIKRKAYRMETENPKHKLNGQSDSELFVIRTCLDIPFLSIFKLGRGDFRSNE
uniref:Uncharacterized protein n=1 Tax=Schistocephalus solidus TaxID=70667 RepID=A0A0X3PG98_SCHSO